MGTPFKQSNWDKSILVLLTASVFLIIVAKFIAAETFIISTFGDRDLLRGASLGNIFWVTGAELQHREGMRVPGGALSYFIYLIQIINPSPLFIYNTILSLSLFSGVLFLDLGRRHFTPIAGMAAWLIFISTNMLGSETHELWNPHFSIPFIVIAFYFLSRFIIEKRDWQFFLFIGTSAIATQMLMAAFYLFLIGLSVALIFVRPIKIAHLLKGLVVIVAIYSPYILNRTLGIFEVTEIVPHIIGNYITEPINISYSLKTLSKIFSEFFSNFSIGDFNKINISLPVPIISLIISSAALLALKKYVVGTSYDNKAEKTFNYLKVIVLITFTFMIILDLSLKIIGSLTTETRYFLSLLPFVAMMGGLGISVLLAVFAQLGKFKWRLAATSSILVIIIFKTVTVSYSTVRLLDIPMSDRPSFKQLDNILKDIAANFGFNKPNILNRVVFIHKSNSWMTHIVPQEYTLQTNVYPTNNKITKGCIAVIGAKSFPNKKDSLRRIMAIKGLSSALFEQKAEFSSKTKKKLLKTIIIREVIHRSDYILINYSWGIDSCPKSLQNPYNPNEAELDTILFFKNSSTETKNITFQQRAKKQKKTNRFYLKHPRLDPRFPIKMRLDLELDLEGAISATLHSQKLRHRGARLNGYWLGYEMKQPELIFISKDELRESILIFPGKLGSQGFVTPWTVTKKLRGIAPYQVIFKFTDDRGTFAYPLSKLFTP